MKCSKAIALVSDFIDGEVGSALKHELESHFAECGECNLVVVQTRRTIEFFIESEAAELPPDVRTRLHGTLRRRLSPPA